MKVLKFPSNETIAYPKTDINYGSGDPKYTHMPILPFESSSERMQQTIEQHHVNVPFDKIITRSDGESICPDCKTKYAGQQYYCTNEVGYYRTKDSYYFKRGDFEVGDHVDGVTKSTCIHDSCRVTQSKRGQCNHYTNWNMQKEFEKQQQFFSFVSFISSLNPDQKSLLQEYSHTLPVGVAHEYRILYLEQTNQNLVMEVSMIRGHLKQIADKMNSAGHCLTF